MVIKTKFIFIIIVFFISVVPIVLAQEEGLQSGGLDLIGMIVAIIIVLITLATISILSGDLRKNWIYLTIAMIFFAISALSVGLDDLTNIPNLEFIGDITEIIFILIMLIFVYNLRKLFIKIGDK